jgi:succinate dehydrogenase / fumarate reductase cytochrome b subunit
MKINRPLSPHLSIYKPQLTSTLSIFHRISGGFLALFLLFSIFSLKLCDLSLSSYKIYWFLFYATVNLDWFFFSVANLALLAFCYHISNGIRHVLWDFGFFLELSKVYTTGAFTLIFSLVLFVFVLLNSLLRVFFF